MKKEINRLKGELLMKQEEKRQQEAKPRHERDNSEIKDLREEIKELKESIKDLREEKNKPKEERQSTQTEQMAQPPPIPTPQPTLGQQYRRPKRWLKNI
mgnify:FL=1